MKNPFPSLLFLLVPALLSAQESRPRPGLWTEISGGVGFIRMGCGGCNEPVTANGGQGFLRIGGTVSPKALLGLELAGFGDDTFGFERGDTTIAAAAASVAVIVLWYPWRSRFFIKGGTGLGTGAFVLTDSLGTTSEVEANGVSLTFGVGFDLPISRKFALTGNAGLWINGIGDVVLPTTTIDDVLPTFYSITIGFTFR